MSGPHRLALRAALLASLLPGGMSAQEEARPDTLPGDSLPRYVLEEVRVEASRMEARAAELAASVRLVGRAAVETRPTRLLTDAISFEPGVLVQQTTAGQGAPLIRSLTGSQVLLMVDGVRLNNGTFRQGPSQYLATVDPEIVDRIEVVRGASSALHGSDAMGGVVNVITRSADDLLEPGERWAGEGSVAFDGAVDGGRVRLGGGASFPDVLGGLGVYGGASWQEQGDLEPGGGLPDQSPTGFTQWGGDLRADLRVGPVLRLELAGQYFEQSDVPRYDRYVDFRAPGVPLGGVGRNDTYLFEPQDRALLRARARWTVGAEWLTSLRVQAAWQDQDEGRRIRGQDVVDGEVVPDDEVEIVFDGVRSLSLDLQALTLGPLEGRGPLGEGSLTWGVEAWDNLTDSHGRLLDVSTGGTAPLLRFDDGRAFDTGRFPDDSRFRGAALYAFLDQRIGDDVRLQLGARESLYWTRTHVGDDFGGAVVSETSDLSGEVGVVWSATDALDLRARYAEAFRAPNVYDLTLVGEVPGGIALPNPALQPEESWNAEMGVRLESGGVEADVTVYRMEIEGLIDRVRGTFQGDTLFRGERVIAVQNVGEATVHGVEAALEAPLPREGRLSASGFWTRGDATVVRDDAVVEEPMSRVPPPQVTGRFRWPLEVAGRDGWWEYSVSAAGEQDRLGFRDRIDTRIQEGGTPGWVVHSLRAALDVARGVRVVVAVENLADELHRVHGSGVDAPGRHLYVRLDWRGSP